MEQSCWAKLLWVHDLFSNCSDEEIDVIMFKSGIIIRSVEEYN